MYTQIKQLADEAIALQNKDRMDAVLREISGLAMRGSMLTMFEDARIEKYGAEPCPECMKPRARCAPVEEVAAAPAEVHGDPIVDPSPGADAYKAATEAAKSTKPAPAGATAVCAAPLGNLVVTNVKVEPAASGTSAKSKKGGAK